MTEKGADRWRVHVGDARSSDAIFDDVLGRRGEITLTITSPPYLGLVDYGHEKQIGFGQSLQEYLVDCANLFKTIRERTAENGSMWVVVDSIRDRSANAHLPLPFLLLECAADSGWTCQDVLIWRKDRGLPWSNKGRLRNSFEYILHFSASSDYKFNVNRLRSFDDNTKWWVRFPERYHPDGQVPTNVWDFPVPLQGAWNGASVRHPCPLPDALVDRIVQLASDEGDVVFDPFAGAGTVVRRANALGRRSFGVELNPAVGESLIAEPEASVAGPSRGPSPQEIMQLRALKWARLVSESGRRKDGSSDVSMVFVEPDVASLVDGSWVIDVSVYLYIVDEKALEPVESAAMTIASRRPASKFGVNGKIHCVLEGDSPLLADRGAPLYQYSSGRTWASMPWDPANGNGLSQGRGKKYPSIISTVNLSFVDERD